MVLNEYLTDFDRLYNYINVIHTSLRDDKTLINDLKIGIIKCDGYKLKSDIKKILNFGETFKNEHVLIFEILKYFVQQQRLEIILDAITISGAKEALDKIKIYNYFEGELDKLIKYKRDDKRITVIFEKDLSLYKNTIALFVRKIKELIFITESFKKISYGDFVDVDELWNSMVEFEVMENLFMIDSSVPFDLDKMILNQENAKYLKILTENIKFIIENLNTIYLTTQNEFLKEGSDIALKLISMYNKYKNSYSELLKIYNMNSYKIGRLDELYYDQKSKIIAVLSEIGEVEEEELLLKYLMGNSKVTDLLYNNIDEVKRFSELKNKLLADVSKNNLISK